MKNKYLLFVPLLLTLVPMIAAYEVVTAQQPLDMVYLLVEQTFGGILTTAIGMILIFIVVGMMSKMNPLTITYFCILFAATFAIGYVGAVAAFLIGLFAIYYVWNSYKNWQNSGGGS